MVAVFCPSTLHIGLKYYYTNNVFSIKMLIWVDLFDYKTLLFCELKANP